MARALRRPCIHIHRACAEWSEIDAVVAELEDQWLAGERQEAALCAEFGWADDDCQAPNAGLDKEIVF